ncbi:MAG: dienelactone hydrolase family protein [Verrucomicrobiota bacterium]|nr:dienelactone hydrolase family protein [Verrucomicrobiota bacterium]
MKRIILLGLLFASLAIARAEIHTESVDYKQGDTTLEGYLAYDKSVSGKRPGVLIVHQWKGLSAYEKKRAEMLAKMGYAVFAVDIYGKGIRPSDPKLAGAEAGKYKSDRKLLRERVLAGLATFKKQAMVDGDRIAAIGYCFGGTTALELARAGADVEGVVSFHGGLGTPTPEDAKQIKCRVLALHGADDPFVPPAEVAAFEEEMRKGKVDWQLVSYGGAVHSFTDWNAGSDNSKGSAYNEKADKRSWEAMKVFFEELFAKN